VRVFDCVILSHWGEMALLEKRFRACEGMPEVTHVICEAEPAVFPDSDLAARWRGRWNYVKVEAREITGNREECLREFLLHGFNGEPGDLIVFSDIRDTFDMAAGRPRGSIVSMADLTR
jgi:hypothetical protein